MTRASYTVMLIVGAEQRPGLRRVMSLSRLGAAWQLSRLAVAYRPGFKVDIHTARSGCASKRPLRALKHPGASCCGTMNSYWSKEPWAFRRPSVAPPVIHDKQRGLVSGIHVPGDCGWHPPRWSSVCVSMALESKDLMAMPPGEFTVPSSMAYSCPGQNPVWNMTHRGHRLGSRACNSVLPVMNTEGSESVSELTSLTATKMPVLVTRLRWIVTPSTAAGLSAKRSTSA